MRLVILGKWILPHSTILKIYSKFFIPTFAVPVAMRFRFNKALFALPVYTLCHSLIFGAAPPMPWNNTFGGDLTLSEQ